MSFFQNFSEQLDLVEDDGTEVPLPVVFAKVLDTITLTGISAAGATLTLDELVTQAQAPSSPALQAVRNRAPNLVFYWVFVTVSMDDITQLIDEAQTQNPSYEPPMFDHFLEVPCIAGIDSAALADALNAWVDVIDYAEVVGQASDPGVTSTGNPFFAQQGYWAPAPEGVDAAAAWGKGADGSIGADGQPLFVVDIEQGWFINEQGPPPLPGQQDLPTSITRLWGTNLPSSYSHGAAVVGEIVGIDNTIGIVGGAPGANARVISYNDKAGQIYHWQRAADRILNLAQFRTVAFGDVILLEIQIDGQIRGGTHEVPIETYEPAFRAIELATNLGKIVVEVAGNGGSDLDTWVVPNGNSNHWRKGQHRLSRSTPSEFAESGAIMVAASAYPVPHHLWTGDPTLPQPRGTDYGSRIDCYAWGENIVTTGWDPNTPSATNIYWGINYFAGPASPGGDFRDSSPPGSTVAFFGGTSGAAPIIVSCCLLVQHLRKLLTPKSGGARLGPKEMRRVLSDPNNGTPSFLTTDLIGVMPDLAKIIANEFQ